jgi:hypothetical protein
MLPAGLITEIDRDARLVRVDASSEQIKEAPEFDGDVAPAPELERQLLDHFEDAAAAPEPLTGPRWICRSAATRADTAPQESSPLVAGPFASTEPEAPQRDDAVREDTASTSAAKPPSASTVRTDASARANTEAPDVPVTATSGDRPATGGELTSAVEDAPAASETTETPDLGADAASSSSDQSSTSETATGSVIDTEASDAATAEFATAAETESTEASEPLPHAGRALRAQAREPQDGARADRSAPLRSALARL